MKSLKESFIKAKDLDNIRTEKYYVLHVFNRDEIKTIEKIFGFDLVESKTKVVYILIPDNVNVHKIIDTIPEYVEWKLYKQKIPMSKEKLIKVIEDIASLSKAYEFELEEYKL